MTVTVRRSFVCAYIGRKYILATVVLGGDSEYMYFNFSVGRVYVVHLSFSWRLKLATTRVDTHDRERTATTYGTSTMGKSSIYWVVGIHSSSDSEVPSASPSLSLITSPQYTHEGDGRLREQSASTSQSAIRGPQFGLPLA